MDAALVDGDHNWFTVYHELRMFAETAKKEKRPLPVLVLHDVSWPYGRRDLYYAPDRIPAESRQPYRRAGMRPGTSRLFGTGGMNLTMANAEHEGGPRNGVRTALDDFVAEHPEPIRVVVLPIYYGLAIAADERTLQQHPALAEILDRIESPAGQTELVELSEQIRLDEAIFTQAWVRTLEQQVDRTATRYLETVKGSLLNEHYLESEVRTAYLAGLEGALADPAALRDPVRNLPLRFQRHQEVRQAGRAVSWSFGERPYTEMGRARIDHLEASLRTIRAEAVPGDLVEVGVGRGGGAIFMRAFLEAFEVPDRTVWAVDRFRPAIGDAHTQFADLNQVRDGFDRFGLHDDRVRFLQGATADVLDDAEIGSLALLRLGEDLGEDLEAALTRLHPLLSPGGVVVVAGVGQPAVEKTLEETRRRLGIDAPLQRVDWNCVTWRIPEATGEVAPGGLRSRLGGLRRRGASDPVPHRPAPVPPVPTGAVDLSIVVVFYNMRREAARTLQSLTRSYQRDLGDLTYEVLAVDNGSRPDERLTDDYVAGFGPEFRLIDMGEAAKPSPTVALNAGIQASRGRNLALMIDGAHVLSPGVLHFGMSGLRTYEPAVVATQQWYVGPGQQGDSQQAGYDQGAEDRLFNSIGWPVDGYKLFEISHFIGERDWFDGIPESNCLFVPRSLLEQLGAFDDSFDMAGGGYANLDLFDRLAQTPGVTATTILGEGSFHQVHGGNTTNVADAAARRERVKSYEEHFRDLRGRRFLGAIDRPVHFVGSMPTRAARRTRTRRQVSLGFDALREHNPQGKPPLTDELRLAAIEAMWDQEAWRDATWLGQPVNRYPTDLFVYQELISETRPGLVVVVGDDPGLGGRAHFLATVAERTGDGIVVAVGEQPAEARHDHDRLTHVVGSALDPEVAAQVAQLAGDEPSALVLLGTRDLVTTLAAFEQYAPL
ncbi:MAG TPA: CmcI family methyltransferase, partial [Ornithinibacter sp.]|nr:CmcI family methyltransferase [Ornithinibacter sp.]